MPTGPDEVRRAVLDSAAELFSRDGVSEVTLRDVATAAQVNLSLINRYIGSRDDLIETVLADLTDQLVAEIRDDPTGARGFEADSVMARWTKVLTHLVLVAPDTAVRIGSPPVEELTRIVVRLYDQSEDAARLRVAQLLASALGWRLFESYLLDAAALSDEPVDVIRDELTRTHRRLAATPLPSPPDPTVRG
jgi:AcrR family transcriptional regulator